MPRRRAQHRAHQGRTARAQAKNAAAAKKIKIQLPPKPDVKQLKNVLNGVVSASIEMRIRSLVQIVNWYDVAVDYMIKKSAGDAVMAKQLQDKLARLSRANKARELGINPGAGMPEKEQALRTAVFQFELYCNSAVLPDTIANIKDKIAREKAEIVWKEKNWNWPNLASYYKRYEEEKVQLEAKEAAANAKYADLIAALTSAFPNVPVKFKVTDDVQGRKFDGSGTMMYGKAVAREMARTLRKEGILKVMVNELIPITTIMALTQDANGNNVRDAKVQLGAIDAVLKGFVAYAQSEQGPAKILRRGNFQPNPQPAAGNAPNRQPRAPRQPGQGGKSLVGGRYRSGSAIATLYSRMADEKEHTKQELFAGLGACEGGKDAPFTRLLRHVGLFNEFAIEVKGDKVTMTLGKGGN